MKIYDISVTLSPDLPVYPGDPPVRIDPVTRMAAGEPANLSLLTLGTHSGTHLDVPRHIRDDGLTVDAVPLSLLIGQAVVVEVPGVQAIGARELSRLPVRGEERVLLKTDNSGDWSRQAFTPEFAHLTEEGGRFLVEAGVRLIGIDYLSIERFPGDGALHRYLLDSGTVILEGVNLDGVAAGRYELVCLPLKVEEGDGAPVRAILRTLRERGEGGEFDPHSSRWPLA